MSHVKVYGLKFNKQELKEILYKRYKHQSDVQSSKPMLCYLTEFLLKDTKKNHPNHDINVFYTGWYDWHGDECVIGIELSYYRVEKSLPTEDPDKFESIAAYKEYTYGFKVHELKYLKSPDRHELDGVFDDLKKLTGVKDMKPSTYKVEKC